MRIKNVGKCTIVFKGGQLSAGKVAVFRGASEKIGSALLKAYPRNLEDLDKIKQEDIIDVVLGDTQVEEPKEEPVKEVAKVSPAKKVVKNKAPTKKSKK